MSESIALLTGATELMPGNASRVARGLRTITLGLQGLDDEGTTSFELVSKLNDQFKKLGISLSDESGQLRSSYDILYDLNGVWGTLDKNTKVYISELIAGKNQVDVFTALMSNFTSVISANETALNSAGSAAKENATYMDSLEAKVSALKQSFQELSNSIVDNDLVKILLDVGKAGLDIANTPVGKFALVAGGITAVTVALASMWNVLKLGEAFSAVFAGGATTLAGGLAAINVPLIATIAGISALIALFPTLKSWYDDVTATTEDYSGKIEANKSKLDENKAKLEELNNTPWFDRTSDIEKETAKIEAENQKLQDQIDSYKKLSLEKAKEATSKSYKVYGEDKKYSSGTLGITFQSYEDAMESIYKIYGEESKYADYLIKNLTEVGDGAKKAGQALENDLVKIVEDYNTALKDNDSESTKVIKTYGNNKDTIDTLVESYKSIVASGGKLTDSQQKLLDAVDATTGAYEEATKLSSVMDTGLASNKQEVDALAKKYPELVNGLNNCSTAALDLIANQEIFNNAKLDVSQKITALKQVALAAGVASDLISSVTSEERTGGTLRHLTNVQKRNGKIISGGKSLQEAETLMLRGMWDEMMASIAEPSVPSVPSAGSSSGKAATSSKSKTQTDPIEEQNKLFKEQLSILEDRLVILQKSGAPQEEQVAQMKKVQDALHEQAEWYRSKGLDENSKYLSELGSQWWDYSNQIKAINDKIAEEAREAQKAQLESQKSAYEALFSYMVDNIDERINALQEERRVEEDNWNAKIQALKDENDEIERQIELETLQSNLAKARQSQVMVYKDGRFQYAKNIDEISQAQTALDSYKREEALRQETVRLENLKNIAIKAIDDQIEQWEGYKLEWSSVVDSYTKDQDKLIIEQQLGIKLEGENWQERIKNLADYVSQYKSLMSSLSNLSSTSSGEKATAGTPVKDSGSKTNIPSTPIPESKPSQDIKTVISQDIRKKKYATGTLSAAGGLSLVGEGGGPELRVLNQGDGIIPADITRNLWALGSNPYAYMGNAIKSLAGGVSGAMNQIFQIDKLELPNATDAPSLVNGLVRYAHQYSAQRT